MFRNYINFVLKNIIINIVCGLPKIEICQTCNKFKEKKQNIFMYKNN